MRDYPALSVLTNTMPVKNMKTIKTILVPILITAFLAAPLAVKSADQRDHEKSKTPIPYPLAVCIVSGEKLGGDMGKPHVFTHQGREIKLCCKSCLKEFMKDPATYLKKLDTAGPAPAGKEHREHKH